MNFVYIYFLLLIHIFFMQAAQGKTLKAPSLVYPEKPVLVLNWQSDLFTDPLETKGKAFKSYNIDLSYPVIDSTNWKPLILVKSESTSIAQPGLTVGNDKVLINKSLLNRSTGLGVLKTMNDDGYIKFVALYASASDDPYINRRDRDLDLSFLYISPLRGNGQWGISISSTKNRGYLNNKTIVQIGYRHIFNDELNAVLGLGFLETQWMPTSTDSIKLFVEPVGYTLNYSKELPLNLLSIYEIGLSTKSFMHSERIEDDMRLFLEYKYLKTGFELNVTQRSRLGVDFGVTYDRKLYQAKQVFLPIGQEKTFSSELFGGFFWRYDL